ncbi:hypothetical protein KAK07_12740 [Ideonella sp. 4Y16]|uniref:choice-of-anchor tandem repeat GloVer-containing protein n=1 Tax=Ideonella alba TaxID=2824118 RepID=UPI001B387B60|nr:choice-of-anchor tandem repeat GloVer-containing protein [Ideonella alba]MBQ0944204.1 hypothetical protein [Ideonella alba]
MTTAIHRRDFLAWSSASALVVPARAARPDRMDPRVLHVLGASDGSTPQGAPVTGPDGALYGCFMHGGSGSLGQVYRLALDGDYSELVAMRYSDTNGFGPSGEPAFDGQGALWACTMFGGRQRLGTLLRHTAADGPQSWEPGAGRSQGPGQFQGRLAVLGDHLYGIAGLRRDRADNAIYRTPIEQPWRARVIASPRAEGLGAVISGPLSVPGGALVGTTSEPLERGGALYRMDVRSGALQVLHTWSSGGPRGELVLADDGWVWGVLSADRARHQGQVWRCHPRRGALQVVHAFTGGEDGAYPSGGLARHPDGSLWGLTNGGGDLAMPRGTLYRITPDGEYAVMHRFSEDDPCGYSPEGAPGIAADGSVVGCTGAGGALGRGTLFALDYVA